MAAEETQEQVKEQYNLSWSPPDYTVDEHGKIVGYVNERQPNNWGRWGELDQRGTVNYITPEIVRDAAGLIQTGEIISCAAPLDATGPVHPTRNGMTHFYAYTGADFIAGTEMREHFPNFQGTDDYLIMATQASTQWDGLSHFGYKDTLYNGFWMGNVEQYMGAKRCSIHHMKDSLCGRGVFLDIARHKGVERLEQGYAITVEDLEACIAAQGVEIRSGDILIFRTGHLPWWYTLSQAEKLSFWDGEPGLSITCVDWLHEHEIAAVAADNIALEVSPHEGDFEHVYPMHSRLIRDLGMTLGEIWNLEPLSESCARDGRYEFFVAAQPLNLTNASGTPLNPIVIK
jgi:kynurenine formamidase